MSDRGITLNISTRPGEKKKIKILDSISVDDVVAHLVKRELFSLKTGTKVDSSVPQRYKDALIKARNPVS